MVGFAAGGVTDLAMRALAEHAGDYLGQPVLVEVRTGAGGTLPAQLLQTAAADGYTIAHIGTGIYRLPHTVKLAWDPYTDISHIIRLGGYVIGPFTAVVGLIRNWADLVQAARKEPGLLAYASPGALTGSHVAMALTAERLGMRLNHVPYKGGSEVRQAILSGQVPIGVDAIGAQHTTSGQFRVLAIWAERRITALPEVPTFTELGVPIVETAAFGIGAPRGTPAPVVSRLHDAFKHALDQPSLRDLFNRENLLVQYLGPQAFLEDVRARYANERQTLVRLGLISS